MSTDGWIKMTDRQPTDHDLAIEVWDVEAKTVRAFTSFNRCVAWSCHPDYAFWTHWKPLKLSEPPKEKTQVEKDAAAFRDYIHDEGDCAWMLPVWRAALKWERDEVRKILCGRPLSSEPMVEAVKARTGGAP